MRKLFPVLIGLLMLAGFAAAETCYDIQYVEDPASDDASPLVGEVVTVTAYVTFEPASGGGDKWFIADDAGAWNGVYIDGDPGMDLGFGWEVEVTGTVAESYGQTVLDITGDEASVTVVSDDVDWSDLPEACAYTVISCEGIDDAATAEQYEGVLVQIEDVTRNATDFDYGEWFVEDGDGNEARIDNPASDDFGYYHQTAEGMPYEWVRGAMAYSYSHYKIVPEIAFDLNVDADGVDWFDPIAFAQQVRPMDMTIQEDDNGDLYLNDGGYAGFVRWGLDRDDAADTTGNTEYVTFHGIVTMPTGLSYAGDGVKFIFSDYYTDPTENSPWSAVLSYDTDAETFPDLYEGDEIVFTGYCDEYQTGPANMTEVWVASELSFLSAGNDVPQPKVLTTNELRDPRIAEQWGTAFVEVQDGVVSDNDQPYDELFIIDSDLGDDVPGIIVDADSDSMDGFIVPAVGTGIDSLWGWLYPHYGDLEDPDGDNYYLKIEPLYPDNVVIGEGPPNVLSVTRNPAAPGADEAVTVAAQIADNSQVVSATIYYKVGVDGEWVTVDMDNTGGIDWEGDIPAQVEGTNVWYYVEGEDDLEQTATNPGDIESNLYGYWATDDLSIYNVQYTPFSSGNSPYANNLVTLRGVITCDSANYDTYEGYFMQTNGEDGDYSGICFSMPAEGGYYGSYGDLVEVTGTVDETGAEWGFKWAGNTKLIDVVDVTRIYGGNVESIYSTDVATVNANLEAYESVVVEFTDIEITALNSYDWSFTDASGDGEFLLDDDMAYDQDLLDWFDGLEVGATVDYVRGIVTYSFGSWKLEVRSMADIGENSVNEDAQARPLEFALNPVYPNPFNPTTHISYTLPENNSIQLIVYNSLGQMVRTLVNGTQKAGHHTAYWDGMADNGRQVASGIYFLRLVSGQQRQVQKMVLTK